jgi:hypothetical protein
MDHFTLPLHANICLTFWSFCSDDDVSEVFIFLAVLYISKLGSCLNQVVPIACRPSPMRENDSCN